ncbi:MAG TPA: branched-chain amino acid ABC transporter permease, partial [Deltaproteobacteria bacterium]|nr:branched-chain amino acid ABC transporter permease [Deltaproteobacteria bacterium]
YFDLIFTLIAMLIVGGMLSVWLHQFQGLPLPMSMLLAIGLTALAGTAVERLAIRPARGSGLTTLIIITIGVSFILKALVGVVTKDEFQLPALPGPTAVAVLGATITVQTLWILALGAAIVLALGLFLKYTLLGTTLRAMAEDRQAIRNLGVDSQALPVLAFGMSAAIGAAAGVLITPLTQMSWLKGTELGLKGFCAAVLGGMGSLPGAVVGGLVIGIAETCGSAVFSGYKEVIAFALVLAILYTRPQGILGGRL